MNTNMPKWIHTHKYVLERCQSEASVRKGDDRSIGQGSMARSSVSVGTVGSRTRSRGRGVGLGGRTPHGRGGGRSSSRPASVVSAGLRSRTPGKPRGRSQARGSGGRTAATSSRLVSAVVEATGDSRCDWCGSNATKSSGTSADGEVRMNQCDRHHASHASKLGGLTWERVVSMLESSP